MWSRLVFLLFAVSACAAFEKKGPPPGCKTITCDDLFAGMKPLDPNADDDGDGIKNALDQAPLLPEDKDGVDDEDGVPDPDANANAKSEPVSGQAKKALARKASDIDKDGIADAFDLCFDRPEDKDGFEDDDGCPELDNDQDGTSDDKDPCPNVPGTWCTPDKAPRKLDIEGELAFVQKTAKIDPLKAKPVLNEVLSELMADAAMRVEIRGYTDEAGGEEANKKLSAQRADAVKAQLVKLGIAHERLVVVGGGTSASRIEFFVLP